MGIATATQVIEMVVAEKRLVSVSFDKVLDSGEAITGTPTATEVTTSDLTIGSVSASTAVLTIDNESIGIGRAMQFLVSGQVAANSPYSILMTAVTDSSPAQTIKRFCTVRVVSE